MRSARRTAPQSRRAPPACISACASPASRPGDEVITSPYSFVASANCAIYEGATPVFADIDPTHAQPRSRGGRGGDHAAHEGARRGRHLRLPGRVRRADRALRAARDRAVEDSCEALGATYKGKPLGSHGHPAVWAFYPNKQMTTGEGGAVTTGSERAARAARVAAQPGPAGDVELAAARPPRLQLPARRPLGGARDRAAREARPHPRGAPRGGGALRRAAARRRRRDAARRRRRPRSLVVRLRREAAGGRRPRRGDGAALRRRGSRPRRTCRRSTCSRTCASCTASRRGCSRSARTAARARWRCRSMPGSTAKIRSASPTRSAPRSRDGPGWPPL